MSSSPTVLLLGATAQTGLHVLVKLLEAGQETIALSRNLRSPQRKAHPSGATVWWLPAEQFSERVCKADSSAAESLPSPDWLISAGPIKLASEYLDRCPRLQQVVCLSTSSVVSKADSDDPLERQQMEQILRAETQLEKTCSSRNIGLVILRPTLIYGCGMDGNISRMAEFIRRFGFLPLAGKASGLRQPVHVADLAELMVLVARSGVGSGVGSAVGSSVGGQQAYAVAGGSTLPYREMASAVFHALGKKECLISLPPKLLAGGVSVAKTLFGMNSLNAQMVFRQNRDLVFDDHAVRRRYGFHPREFRPGSADFKLPAEFSRYLPD